LQRTFEALNSGVLGVTGASPSGYRNLIPATLTPATLTPATALLYRSAFQDTNFKNSIEVAMMNSFKGTSNNTRFSLNSVVKQ